MIRFRQHPEWVYAAAALSIWIGFASITAGMIRHTQYDSPSKSK